MGKVAAESGEVDAIYDRYNKVRANAIRLLDPTPLRTVEAGPVLAIDAGALEVAEQLSKTGAAPVWRSSTSCHRG